MAQEEIIFPNNIRTIRLNAGMKMTELARKTGLSLPCFFYGKLPPLLRVPF